MLAQLDEVVAELAADEQAGGRVPRAGPGRRRGLADRTAAARRPRSSTTSSSATATAATASCACGTAPGATTPRASARSCRPCCAPAWRPATRLGPRRRSTTADLPRALRTLARMARAGARGREATKSRMVLVAHRLESRLPAPGGAAGRDRPAARRRPGVLLRPLRAARGGRAPSDIAELVAARRVAARGAALPGPAGVPGRLGRQAGAVPAAAARGHRGRRDRRSAGVQRRRRGHRSGSRPPSRRRRRCSPARSWWRR